MGIRMLSPSKPACPRQRRIRLVFANGSVCDLKEAMSAGEALQSCLHNLVDISDNSFNNFLVCDSMSLCIGKRACPVHPDVQLEQGHLYYVLPIGTYQHRLSWSHISALAAMAMSSSTTTPPSSMSVNDKSSLVKISEECAVSRAFARIPDAKFYLRFLPHHRLLSKGKCKLEGAHIASRGKGASSHLALDTEGRRADICDSPEVNSKYVELLIERSNSWKLTIQESLAV